MASQKVYRFVRGLARAILPLLVRIEIVGLENIGDAPYILATNHLSVFDTPILLTVCPHTIRAFAAEKHRPHPIFGPLLTLMGSIWVRRGEVDRQALREALAVLQRGEALGMAPEGTRARGVYALQKAKTGPVYLAARAGVPIVPVGLIGTEKVKLNLRRLRRTDVQVMIGEPFHLPETGRVRGEQLEEYTDLLMRRIAALLPEEYRGVYR